MKKSLRITLIVLGCIAAFIIIVFLFASLFGGCIAKNYVNKNSEKLIGRQASVEHVGLNLFTGHVAVHGLSVMEENATDQFAGFDTLDVSVSLLRLIGKTVYVRHITLAGLDARILQDSNRFNFTSIIEHFQKDSAEVEEEPDTTPSNWFVSLHNIKFANGSAYYADIPRQSHIGFRDLTIYVPDFSFGGKDRTDAGLTLELADGGALTVNADYTAENGDFNVTLDLENFALNQVMPYIMDRAYIEEIKGLLAVNATAQGNTNHILDMVIAAKASVKDVDILDNSQSSVASLKSLEANLGKLVLSQNLFDINSITLDGLSARYEQFADSTNTLSRLLIPDTTATATAEPQEEVQADTLTGNSSPLKLHVGHLALTNINLCYADHTMPDDFEFPVNDLSVLADNISTAGNNNARIQANLPNGGKLMVDWKGNISDWKLNQSLFLAIKDLHLSDLSPYMVSYFGMPFSEGVFSFTSSNTIHNSQLKGDNHIDIFKATLGDKRKDVKPQLHLPVRAALYVLKDKDDKIMLDVPVAGNIDNPEFNYMKLVWKTLGNLIVKVATSPARALGNWIGNGDDAAPFISIDAHEKEFTSEQYYQIDRVAEMAKADESIQLQFELQRRPTDNDELTANYLRLNKLLQKHLEQLGLRKSQISITNAEPKADVKEEGYLVTTKIL